MTSQLIDHSAVDSRAVLFASTPDQAERACYIERRTRSYRVAIVMNTGEMRQYISAYSPTPNSTGAKTGDALRLAADAHIVSSTTGSFTAQPLLASDVQSLRAHLDDEMLIPLLPFAIATQLKPTIPVGTKPAFA